MDIHLITHNKRLPQTRCPYCQTLVDAVTEANSSGKFSVPVPGDYTICLYCNELLRFGPLMDLRKIPPEKREGLEKSEIIAAMRLANSRRIRAERRDRN